MYLNETCVNKKKDDIDSHRHNIRRVRKQTSQTEYEDDVR